MESTTLEKVFKGEIPKVPVLILEIRAQLKPKIFIVRDTNSMEAELEIETTKMIAVKAIDTGNRVRIIAPRIEGKKIYITEKSKVYAVSMKKGMNFI